MAKKKKKKNKKSSMIINIILVLILLTGIGIMAYPSFSDWWNSMHQSRAIAGYVEQVANTDQEDLDRMWEEAEAYNERLRSKPNRYILSDEEVEEYESILNVTGTGIMGYIDIPKVGVSLPIYHGTDEAVLQIAVGHIEGSSFPVGGQGTHSLLSGHRGLPSAKLFTDIDQLVVGDRFMVNTLNRMLTYEVDQIRVVLPDELQDLQIDPNEDYITLITCTPYRINTHRLLVRGHRVENDKVQISVPADAVKMDTTIVAVVVGVPILLVMIIIVLITTHKKKEKINNELDLDTEEEG